MFAQYDDIVSVDDLMEMLDIGRNKAYELLNSGQIKSIKMKGYRIPKLAIKDFVLSQSKITMERYKELSED
jgi:predicted transcriptional regulator of viral defense system